MKKKAQRAVGLILILALVATMIPFTSAVSDVRYNVTSSQSGKYVTCYRRSGIAPTIWIDINNCSYCSNSLVVRSSSGGWLYSTSLSFCSFVKVNLGNIANKDAYRVYVYPQKGSAAVEIWGNVNIA